MLNSLIKKVIVSTSIFIIANMLTVSLAQAKIDYVTCNGCSDSRMKLTASSTNKNQIVNVVDFYNFKTKSFIVFNEPGHSSAQEIPANSVLDSGIKEFQRFQQYLDNTLRNTDIQATDLTEYLLNKDSASDFIKVIRFEDRQRDIAEALGKYLGKNLDVTVYKNLSAIFASTAVSKFATPMGYEVKIKFGDDYLVFKYMGLTLSNGNIVATFTPKAGSGRIGDIRLTSTSDYGFRLYGNGVDIISALEGMGFNINYGRSSRTQVSSGTATIGCSGSRANPCFVID